MNFLNNLAVGLDPNMIDVGVEYFVVAAKYGTIFGILGLLIRMLIRAFTGKERFI